MALYVCRDGDAIAQEDLRRMVRLMPPDRRVRWQKFRSDQDARNLVVAYWLAMFGLQQESPEAAGLPWRYSRYGKPAVEGTEFNISHSAELCACGVSRSEIGVDVQQIERSLDVVELAEVVMGAREMARITQALDSHSAFIRLWAMKESYVKCLGGGLYYQLPSIDLSGLSEGGGEYRGLQLETWRHGDYWFSVCTREGGQWPSDVHHVPAEALLSLAEQMGPSVNLDASATPIRRGIMPDETAAPGTDDLRSVQGASSCSHPGPSGNRHRVPLAWAGWVRWMRESQVVP